MPRRARLRAAGIALHVIQRGNNHSVCFHEEKNYQVYLDMLRELSRKSDCLVHAYCLMTNHIHLLLTPNQEDSASRMLKILGQRYAQYFNRTYQRTGTLWEGRFRSSLVQSENYLLACYRYIESNPVRAGMVEDVSDYPWSSYRVNAGIQESDWLAFHSVYMGLGSNMKKRQAAYRRLFVSDLEPEMIDKISTYTNGGFVLGDEGFKRKMARALRQRVSPGMAGRPAKFKRRSL